MKTSYFGNMRKLEGEKNVVSIARGNPKWFKGRIYYDLAPSWQMVKMKDMGEYTRLFNQILDKLDAHKVVEELGEDAVLLCYEKPGDFCHRHLVAEWIEKETGIRVEEFGKCNHGKEHQEPVKKEIPKRSTEPFVPQYTREVNGQINLFGEL